MSRRYPVVPFHSIPFHLNKLTWHLPSSLAPTNGPQSSNSRGTPSRTNHPQARSLPEPPPLHRRWKEEGTRECTAPPDRQPSRNDPTRRCRVLPTRPWRRGPRWRSRWWRGRWWARRRWRTQRGHWRGGRAAPAALHPPRLAAARCWPAGGGRRQHSADGIRRASCRPPAGLRVG